MKSASLQGKIRVGISSCLLGNQVRYDGGHQLDPFITGTLGRYVEFVPVCPEVECGLPVPREAMRLEGDPENPHLMTIHTRVDLTNQLRDWARRRVQELVSQELCGFIFKSKSPSSGMERVKVYTGRGAPVKKGTGLFAREVKNRLPLLPMEDEGRLHDPELRENFIERLFVYQRWRSLLAENPTPAGLVEFHTRHKLLILAHSPKHYRELGRLAAQSGLGKQELFSGYERLLLTALQLKATPGKNTNVLLHLAGYFKQQLTASEKQELQEIIEQYRQGHLPLIVPVTLLNHYVRKYGERYLAEQWYLHPHPVELKLRNHA